MLKSSPHVPGVLTVALFGDLRVTQADDEPRL